MEAYGKLSSNADIQGIERLILEFVNQLPGPVTPEKLTRFDQSVYIQWKHFAQTEYFEFIQIIVGKFDRVWPIDVHKNLYDLFAIDECCDFVMSAIDVLTASEHKKKMPILCKILEKIVLDDTLLFAAFVDLSFGHVTHEKATDFFQQLTSLPNRIANEMKSNMPDVFVPETFCNILMINMLKAIHFMAHVNHNNKASTFGTVSMAQLFSKVIVDFNVNRSSDALKNAINILMCWSNEEKFMVFINEMILALNRHAINVLSVMLVHDAYTIYPLLQSAILTNEHWKYCLLTKIPLLNYYTSQTVAINLISYLAHVEDATTMLIDLLMELLDVWSSKTVILKTSIDQQIYVTKLIVLCVHELDKKSAISSDLREKIKRKLFNGVGYHMESQTATLRCIGMITAETVLAIVLSKEMEDMEKLKFDYAAFSQDDTSLIECLKAIGKCIDAVRSSIDINVDSIVENMTAQINSKKNNKTASKSVAVASRSVLSNLEYFTVHQNLIKMSNKKSTEELDSDDDLEPYDMSNDVPAGPKYLLDLKDQLLETEDSDVFAICLEASQLLIEEQLPNNDIKLGLDLLRILISLERRFYMENFGQYRLSACIAICCVYPKESAEYLCQQIHSKAATYSISTKVLMLDILSEACKALSKIQLATQQRPQSQATTAIGLKLVNLNGEETEMKVAAANIIRQRVEAKTRRFATKSPNPFARAQKNRFSDVAGYFFYPLLHGFGKRQLSMNVNRTLDHDVDNVLLVNLLNTISTVMLAAKNCAIAIKFAQEIFRLTAVLRFSAEPKIRAATTQMIAVVFLAVPKDLLASVLFDDICEIKTWLEACVDTNIIRSGERNADCREIARHALALCYDCFK